MNYVRRKLKRYPPLRSMAGLLFDKLFPVTKMSYEGEEEGSGILWGVDGVVRIAHGACRAPDIVHGIASARKAVEDDVVASLKQGLKQELEKFKKDTKS